MKQAFLEIGRILSTHALSGEVKFEVWGDDESAAKRLGRVYLDRAGTSELTVKNCRVHGKFLLFSFEGIGDADAAARLRMKTLYARREDLGLPEDTVFWADLIGEKAVDAATGEVYGTITDIYNRGASDIWEITRGEKTVLFPAAKPFVVSLSPEGGARILPPEGLF